ncbi:hypothetical protein OJ252_2600 [Cryptosporidium canis]|uniref:Uncharacterized protein n=1 Tax=Cryptosporidium canis TaxID=195482 RepID=A0ABQ8P5S1_9CRYT|nr:hypothetical protein OJ252_2600 [Cryptosporidium canis]
MSSEELREVCIVSPRIHLTYQKLLRAVLRPSIFILDLEEDDFRSEFKEFLLGFLRARLGKAGPREEELFWTRKAKNSAIPASYKLLYLIYKNNISQDLFACRPICRVAPVNTGVSTLIRNVCTCMHVVFILDMGSIFWFSELHDNMSHLEGRAGEFLSGLDSVMGGISRVLGYLGALGESVEAKFSVFLFGASLEESYFKLVFYELPVESWMNETQMLSEHLSREVEDALRLNQDVDDSVQFPRGSWVYELLGLLNSFSACLTQSLMVITTGVISSRLFSERNGSSLICQSNYFIRYCNLKDIQVHFLVVNKFDMGSRDSEIGRVPSLDTLEFVATSCNSTMTVCKLGVGEQDANKIALGMLLRPDRPIELLLSERKVLEDLAALEDVYSYKASQRLSLLEILVNKLRNGFNLVGESRVEVPMVLLSRFHKLVEVICLIESNEEAHGSSGSEFWSVKYYIRSIGGGDSTPYDLSLLREFLESREAQRLNVLNRPHRLTYFLYSFILKNQLLDSWTERLMGLDSKIIMGIPEFPAGLSHMFLPCTIHHEVDLVLQGDRNLFKETCDGFRGSWDLLQAKLIEVGFNTFIIASQHDEYDFPIKEEDRVLVYYNLYPKMGGPSGSRAKLDDQETWRILRSWTSTDSFLQPSRPTGASSRGALTAIWLIAKRFTIKVSERVGSKVEIRESPSSLEYTRRLRELVIKFGVDSDEANLSLLRHSLEANYDFEGDLEGDRFTERSWSYILSSEKEACCNRKTHSEDLNWRVMLAIYNTRFLGGWTLLNRIYHKDTLHSSWYKVCDVRIRDHFSLKLALIYSIKLQPGGGINSSRLACRTLIASSICNCEVDGRIFGEDFSFDGFAQEIQSQDDKVVRAVSLIDYLYSSSRLRGDIEYISSISGNEEDRLSQSGGKGRGFAQRLIKDRVGRMSPGSQTKDRELGRLREIAPNGSLCEGDDLRMLSLEEIRALFFTYKDNEESQEPGESGMRAPATSETAGSTSPEVELDRDFIRQFEPLCLIEIPLIDYKIMKARGHGSTLAKRKYLEDTSEGSFEKFLLKLSKITDRSVRVDEDERYAILFIEENDICNRSPGHGGSAIGDGLGSGTCELESSSKGYVVRRLSCDSNYEYIIITHIRLQRDGSRRPKCLVFGVYLCSYYNLSFGITQRRANLEMSSEEEEKLKRARGFVELYIYRIKEIWNSIKFKTISKYYLIGVAVCPKDIVRLHNEAEMEEERPLSCPTLELEFISINVADGALGDFGSRLVDPEFDINFDESVSQDGLLFGSNSDQEQVSEIASSSDQESCPETGLDFHGYGHVRREVCKYLSCNIYRFKLSLSSFKTVLSRKFRRYLEITKGLTELDNVARLIGEELEGRLETCMELKLVHLDSKSLDRFLVFCGTLSLYNGKSENIIVTISLVRDGRIFGVSYSELQRLWDRLGESPGLTPSWYHGLVWRSLAEKDDLELFVNMFTPVYKKYIRVNKINMEHRSLIKLRTEAFASKLHNTLSLWIVDMTMELSFIHGCEIWGRSLDEPCRLSLFACFGREVLFECLRGAREKAWSENEEVDLGGALGRSTLRTFGSLMFTRDIQLPLISSSTRFGNDIAVINLLSSQADYIPIKREPSLILIWHGSRFPMDSLSIENPRLVDKLRGGSIEDLLEHIRVLADISSVSRSSDGDELVLRMALKIYFPSSFIRGMGVSSKSKFNCRICDFHIEEGGLHESINFLYATMQSRFINIWKEATCDFLLQNVTISRRASFLLVPKFIPADYSVSSREGDQRKTGISVLNSVERESIFGHVSVASEWLYEVPFEVSPAKFRRLQRNDSTGRLQRRLDPDFYEKPGEAVLWNGETTQVPNYVFWLKRHDEVFIEVPSVLYGAPLIDVLFGGGEWDISTIGRYTKQLYTMEKSLFGKYGLGKESEGASDSRSSTKEIELVSLVYPRGWLLFSEDATTSTNTIGGGSLFLIKPDYIFIDLNSSYVNAYRRKKDSKAYDESDQGYSAGQSASASASASSSRFKYISTAKSNVGISLSFFGKRKPSKNTKLYFYKQLKTALQRLLSGWSSSPHTGVISKAISGSGVEEMYLTSNVALVSDRNREVPYHLTFILKLGKVYQSFMAVAISRVASRARVIFRFGDLFNALTKILDDYGIKYEVIDRGIRLFNRNMDIDSKPEELEYSVDISFYSGINGRILDISDPWAVGSTLDEGANPDLESYVGDCLLPLLDEEAHPSGSPFWDFNKILELVFLQRSDGPDNLGSRISSGGSSWSLVRDSGGRISKIQGQSVSSQTSGADSGPGGETRSCGFPSQAVQTRPPIYLMPCIYIGADVSYKERSFGDGDEDGVEMNRRASRMVLFIDAILNLMFMELLIRSKLTFKENWVLRERPQLSDDESAGESGTHFDGSFAIHGQDWPGDHAATIVDLIKYSEDLQNFFQVVVGNRETIEALIPLGPKPSVDTTMMRYPVPRLVIDDVSGGRDESRMYFPSWCASEFIRIVREEIQAIQSDGAVGRRLMAVVSGYACVIHDAKEPNTDEGILRREDGDSQSGSSSLSMVFPEVERDLKETDVKEYGWHVLKYKSRISYLNSVGSRTDSEIDSWVDSLYDELRAPLGGRSCDLSMASIYGSFFNMSGGRNRPCITANIHLNSGTMVEYMIFLEFTPNEIVLVCWDVPSLVVQSFERKIKRFIYLNSVRMLWSIQLSIWYKYNSVYRRSMFMLDLSNVLTYWSVQSSTTDPSDLHSSRSFNYYPNVCKIPTNLISHIWSGDLDASEIRWSDSDDLYRREIAIECVVDRERLEDTVVPNVVMGRVLDLRFGEFLQLHQAGTGLSWLAPSVLGKIRTLGSDEHIERWSISFFKHRLWIFVGQFLVECFSINGEKQGFAKTPSRSITPHICRSNLIFKYHQVINLLKKKVGVHSMEDSSLHGVTSGFFEDRPGSLVSNEGIIRTHYSLLTYLQNSHTFINTLISAVAASRATHFAVIHPSRSREDEDEDRGQGGRNLACYRKVGSCGVCMANPKDTSIRIILATLFRCSMDILGRLYSEETAKGAGEGEERLHLREMEDRLQCERDWSAREGRAAGGQVAIKKLRCSDNKGEMLVLTEEISGIPVGSLAPSGGEAFSRKELTARLNEYLKDHGFIMVAGSNSQMGSGRCAFKDNYCVSVIQSILCALDLSRGGQHGALGSLQETEAGPEEEIAIYLKTVNIKRYSFSLPVCIFMGLYQSRLRMIYSACAFRGCEPLITASILEFIERVNARGLVFGYIQSYSESLIFRIWSKGSQEQRARCPRYLSSGPSGQRQLSDSLVESVLSLDSLMLSSPSLAGESSFMIFRMWADRDLKPTNGHLASLRASFSHYTESGLFSYRIRAIPDSQNTNMLMFLSMFRDELVGAIMEEAAADGDVGFPIKCFVLKSQPGLAESPRGGGCPEREKIRWEVLNTLSSIQELIKRDQVVQRIQSYGSKCSQRLIDGLVNNRFSVSYSLDDRLLGQLPLIRIQSRHLGGEARMSDKSMMEIQERIDMVVSLFKDFWRENHALKFCNLLYRVGESGETGDFSQSRLISVAVRLHEIILIRFFTTFRVGPDGGVEWTFNSVKFTLKDEAKVRRYFLIGHRGAEAVESREEGRGRLIRMDLYELILKSLDYILDSS